MTTAPPREDAKVGAGDLPGPLHGGYLSLDRISKRFHGTPVLSEVSFSVRRGEIFGYIGPNGAGKTTTIRVLAGLLRPSSGSVSLEGETFRPGDGALSRRIGYLPQIAAFQNWRTVDRALSTFGELSGLDPSTRARRIPEVLEELGISETRHRPIRELSGGTVQKVGLAQAILHRPPLLLLDEPMAALDPASRFQFKAILRDLRAGGTTIFFSSHVLSDVQDVADRFGVVDRGRLRFVGTLAELRAAADTPNAIEIELTTPYDRPIAPDRLPTNRGVERKAPGRLLVHLDPTANRDTLVAPIFDAFRAAGYVVRSIRPVTPDLEETYVRFLRGTGE